MDTNMLSKKDTSCKDNVREISIMKRIRLIITALLAISLVALPGCDDFAFKGKEVDLFSVASNSVLGLSTVDPGIIVIFDKDSYGRILFLYWGYVATASDLTNEYDNGYVIIISQKTKSGYVYYYPDYNFLMYKEDPSWKQHSPTNVELIQYAIDLGIEDRIEWLKTKNDWNNPLDESKCVKVKVSKQGKERDSKGTLVSFEIKEKAYKAIVSETETGRPGFYYLTSDYYDRHIYFFRCIEGDAYTKSYVVIFNKDGTFDPNNGAMEITDVWNYQDELKAFKERNNWNKPPT